MVELIVTPTPGLMLTGGLVLFGLLGFQMLLGYKKVKFAGRTHWKVHKGVAWTIVILAAMHLLTALLYLGILPI